MSEATAADCGTTLTYDYVAGRATECEITLVTTTGGVAGSPATEASTIN